MISAKTFLSTGFPCRNHYYPRLFQTLRNTCGLINVKQVYECNRLINKQLQQDMMSNSWAPIMHSQAHYWQNNQNTRAQGSNYRAILCPTTNRSFWRNYVTIRLQKMSATACWPRHTSYLSQTPQTCLCKKIQSGVKFSRLNVKNCMFLLILGAFVIIFWCFS